MAPPTPLEGIYAAVTRRTLDDKNPDGWIPAQKIGVDDALRAYTRTAAFAMFAEQSRGSLQPGKLADLVMIRHRHHAHRAGADPRRPRRLDRSWRQNRL